MNGIIKIRPIQFPLVMGKRYLSGDRIIKIKNKIVSIPNCFRDEEGNAYIADDEYCREFCGNNKIYYEIVEDELETAQSQEKERIDWVVGEKYEDIKGRVYKLLDIDLRVIARGQNSMIFLDQYNDDDGMWNDYERSAPRNPIQWMNVPMPKE